MQLFHVCSHGGKTDVELKKLDDDDSISVIRCGSATFPNLRYREPLIGATQAVTDHHLIPLYLCYHQHHHLCYFCWCCSPLPRMLLHSFPDST